MGIGLENRKPSRVRGFDPQRSEGDGSAAGTRRARRTNVSESIPPLPNSSKCCLQIGIQAKLERAFRSIDLSHSEIERLCRQYFKNKGALQSFVILSGGAVNTTFKILWGNEWFVLRIYAREKYLSGVEKQIYQLIQNRVPVPKMLFASSEGEPYPFALFRFCEAPHLYNVDKIHSCKLSYDLGKVLSKIHRFHFPTAGLFGKDLSIEIPFEKGCSPYLEYCLEHLTESSHAWKRLGNTRAESVINFIVKHRDFFPTIETGGSLVHSDFKPVNLLWDENQGLIVLDWEFAHSGHSLIDFGILLRHFRDFPFNISYLEKGYREDGGDLLLDWIQRARITDFINIVQLLNTQAERPKLFHSLIENIDFTIDKWQTLDSVIKEC